MELCVYVDGDVFVELKFLVVNEGHEVEGGVDDFQLDKILIFAFVHVRF